MPPLSCLVLGETMSRDLGTYHLRVELADGRGWISKWSTGYRYTNGTEHESPLTAMVIEPTWGSEEDLFDTMISMYLHGNYSCDCNKTLFWCRSQQMEEPEDIPCGDMMELQRLTAIRPDQTEKVLWEL